MNPGSVAITSGSVHAFYVFDVSNSVDMAAVRRLLGEEATLATLADKAPGPPKIAYMQPPVVVPAEAAGSGAIDGFSTRVKFFDYGVISIMLSRPFAGAWDDLVRLGQELIENEQLEDRAALACRAVVTRVHEALGGVRADFLREDYLAFVVNELDEPTDADFVLERYGAEIAQMLRGERQALSRQEREEVLRHRLSYLVDDTVVPAYNAAFVLDTPAGAAATLEALEAVNSQLLEFRYHDEALESELTQIYTELLKPPRLMERLVGRRSTRAARRLQSLYIDVNELTDRLENSVKLVGDVYLARLFSLAAARLGLDAWKSNVEQKLRTLNDIYRFAIERTGMAQANLLELVIVLILILEFAMVFR